MPWLLPEKALLVIRLTVRPRCGLVLQQEVGPQFLAHPPLILLMATLNRKKPLVLMCLWTLMPVLLSAFMARVLPRVNPTPLALEVLPLVRETRLLSLAVGTRPRVTLMPQPGSTRMVSPFPMVGLSSTMWEMPPTSLTATPVRQQFGVVPVLKNMACGATLLVPIPLDPTLVQPETMVRTPRDRCPHLRRCPITAPNRAPLLTLTLQRLPVKFMNVRPPVPPMVVNPPMNLLLPVSGLRFPSSLRLVIYPLAFRFLATRLDRCGPVSPMK